MLKPHHLDAEIYIEEIISLQGSRRCMGLPRNYTTPTCVSENHHQRILIFKHLIIMVDCKFLSWGANVNAERLNQIDVEREPHQVDDDIYPCILPLKSMTLIN
jgi:hypothetical protein